MFNIYKAVGGTILLHRLASAVHLYALEGCIDDLYFGILLLDERAVQMRATIALLQSNLGKIRSLQRNGVAMQSDADIVEAEHLTVNQQLAQVEAAHDSYRRMFEIFVGQPVDGKLVRPSVTEPVSQEVARPELSLFDARIDKLAALRVSLPVSGGILHTEGLTRFACDPLRSPRGPCKDYDDRRFASTLFICDKPLEINSGGLS